MQMSDRRARTGRRFAAGGFAIALAPCVAAPLCMAQASPSSRAAYFELAPAPKLNRLLTLDDTVGFFNPVLGLTLNAQEKPDIGAFLHVL